MRRCEEREERELEWGGEEDSHEEVNVPVRRRRSMGRVEDASGTRIMRKRRAARETRIMGDLEAAKA